MTKLQALDISIERWQMEIDLETEGEEYEFVISEKYKNYRDKCGLCEKYRGDEAHFSTYGCKSCPLDEIEQNCFYRNSFFHKARKFNRAGYFFKTMLLAALKSLHELEWYRIKNTNRNDWRASI
jgi:hypothetical protein